MKTTHTPPPIVFPTDQRVEKDIREAFRPIAKAQSAALSFDEIYDAIDQLKKSERGTACLRHFISMMKEYGFGLDASNWRALAALHHAGAAGHQHRILQILEAGK